MILCFIAVLFILMSVISLTSCGSGLSGEVLTEQGHYWVGFDISKSMLGKNYKSFSNVINKEYIK